MRQLTSLTNDEYARRFTAYLFTQGIDTQLEQDGDQWLIWVREEDSLEPARELYQQFQTEPDHERYQGAVQAATTMQREDAKRQQEEQSQRNYIEMRDQWRQGRRRRNNPLTKMLIALSVLVTLLSGGLGSGRPENPWLRHLMFADEVLVIQEQNRIERKSGGLTPADEQRLASISLRTHPWELWRLVTPIFLHASVFGGIGILHLVFNMLWLNDLGSAIEHRYGTPRFCALVLVIAILSVVAQSLAPTTWGPFSGTWAHGGMSGVVYGLVGFIWIRTRLDPTSRLTVRPELIIFMIGWLFFCVFLTQGGTLPVANLAHAAGLLSGMLVARITLPGRG